MIYHKIYLATIVFMLCSFTSFAQSKKSAQRYRLSQTEVTDNKDSKAKKTVDRFDRQGNTIETITYDDDGKINSRETFVYQHKQLSEHAIYTKNDKLKERHAYTYNRWGDETEDVAFDEDNKLSEKSVSLYNANKQRTQILTYNADNQLTKKYSYTYNNKGLLAERKTYNSNDQLIATKTYTYTYRKWKN